MKPESHEVPHCNMPAQIHLHVIPLPS